MNLSAAIISAILLIIPASAFAGPGNGHGNDGNGRGNPHSEREMDRGDHGNDRGHQAMVNESWTPPGLAKKPYGMPPGQAKKLWGRGDQLPNQYYTQSRYYVTNPTSLSLAPAPYGSRWVQVGDHYYLAQTKTGAVMQIVSALTR